MIYPFTYLPLFVGFCVGLCVDMNYFMSFLVLQSSCRGKKRWLLCFYCLSNVFLLYILRGSSSRCRGLVCSLTLRLWYLLIIITNVLVSKTKYIFQIDYTYAHSFARHTRYAHFGGGLRFRSHALVRLIPRFDHFMH